MSMETISQDALSIILECLTARETFKICSVNSKFRSACKNEFMWKRKVLDNFCLNTCLTDKEKSFIRRSTDPKFYTIHKESGPQMMKIYGEYFSKWEAGWRKMTKMLSEEVEKYWEIGAYQRLLCIVEAMHEEIYNVQFDDDVMAQFHKDYVERAFKNGKEIEAVKAILTYFYGPFDNNSDDFIKYFVPLFEKAAEKSPGGKISLQLVLSTRYYKRVYPSEFDQNAWDKAIAYEFNEFDEKNRLEF